MSPWLCTQWLRQCWERSPSWCIEGFLNTFLLLQCLNTVSHWLCKEHPRSCRGRNSIFAAFLCSSSQFARTFCYRQRWSRRSTESEGSFSKVIHLSMQASCLLLIISWKPCSLFWTWRHSLAFWFNCYYNKNQDNFFPLTLKALHLSPVLSYS